MTHDYSAVLQVFACNRPGAVKRIVDRLIRFRPSKELFPITVSQDCNNMPVQRAVAEFRDEVDYVKVCELGDNAKVVVPSVHSHYETYYYISRHYKLALEYVFDKIGHSSVILLEDDLDIAQDFFEYFSATRYLLDRDPMLWCVSAWNDNGKEQSIDLNAVSLLYRSDFFPGLGWMMSRKLWQELKPKWPAGFWDDWLREPENRKGRQCIRPEVSRTMMTPLGKRGASKGQFFDKHLAKVVLSNASVSFTTMNLDYLLNVSSRHLFFVTSTAQLSSIGCFSQVEYTGNIDYIRKADKLRVMHDFKAGVPRTAYRGIVSCFLNGVRIFLVPDRQFVKEYDKKWEVPSQYD
ncbi:unnamed protein product [Heligmosomoides polygyrus]|uniref:Alpha-1,3-mannosyl-glycoprotein 2-beta-N-acetylglucosaminyltransferase n=1 Tax=Heligmosomoides polygyrus TaxID=6339 RepID=A0A183G2E7_HELPZ|nr:unnamed protein product [Heligmosomoides polygyrus]